MRGGYFNHGLKRIFPGRFLAVSIHISILLYIRTSYPKGNVSSFKTQELGGLSYPLMLHNSWYNSLEVNYYCSQIILWHRGGAAMYTWAGSRAFVAPTYRSIQPYFPLQGPLITNLISYMHQNHNFQNPEQ
jgi:hypothetical protein